MIFDPQSFESFSGRYPDQWCVLRHSLSGHQLFRIDQLTALAAALPVESVEYNAGDLPISQDPTTTPMNGLTPEETVRRIAENNSWMVLKNVEQQPSYRQAMDHCLGAIEGIVEKSSGAMHKREAFVFVSSPGSVTPFHMDPEHNILMQLEGSKTFRIYPNKSRDIVSDEQHEAFHIEGAHRNLPYREEFEKQAQAITLKPGDALYVPVKSPHWVAVNDAVSVSLSITWRSAASDNEGLLRRGNGWLRSRGGRPPSPGRAPLRDRAVIISRRIIERLSRH
ncbi:cupin-like domain-containing protein [Hyphococcus flavus]|uniref:Cupin-like domain-containing protein n=1 Tax=Hyphococcus flavus TaxID=1866326 RepID=A0AAF0CC64_9PROT|nr:cupin-like domain-containing protein [Hyphococcus flavus]WDI32710.1 cupin-like domain-containing protein [Hyphococcus flavus]